MPSAKPSKRRRPQHQPSPLVIHTIRRQRGRQPHHNTDSDLDSDDSTNNTQINIQHTDSFTDINTQDMSSLLTPSPFHGLTTEDPDRWMSNFEAWLTIAKINEENQKLAAVQLLLKDSARIWFDNLQPRPVTFTALAILFQTQFKRDDSMTWRDVAHLWTLHQKEGQSCEAFLSQVESTGTRSKASAEQIRHAALNGLLPHIRAAVVMHDVTSLSSIKHYAMLQESVASSAQSSSCPPRPSADHDLHEQLRRLEARLDSIQLNAMTDRSPRSQTPPRHVHFQSDEPREDWRTAQYNQASAYYNTSRSPSQYSQQSFYSSQQPRQQGSTHQPFRGNSRQFNNNTRFNNSQFSYNSCFYCGGSYHPRQFCPARDNTCVKCQKIGHNPDVCRSSQFVNNPPNSQH